MSGQPKSPRRKIRRTKKPQAPREIHGVIFLGHLSDGFCEPQMREYFRQFGEVKQLRLSRSKKTGRSKGYGFIQFESDEIAKIVADTMAAYPMFKKNMTCQHIPTEKVHPNIFRGAQRTFSKPKAHVLARDRHNKALSAGKQNAAVKRLKDKMSRRIQKLQELGVNYSLPVQSHELDEHVKETSS